MSLWTREEVLEATNGQLQGRWSATGISIDTRTMKVGEIFAAISDVRDGHRFVKSAFDSGASAAIVSTIPDDIPSNSPLIIVPDVLHALNTLASYRRNQIKGKVIAVTGSVGKTSTKEMLRVVLSRQGRTHAAVKSFNNHWGVPLTLANTPVDIEYVIVEIGMNKKGEIAPLSRLVRPHVGIITEIAPAHLAAFESLDMIAAEKASLFEGLEEGGFAIINSASAGQDIMERCAHRANAEIVHFGNSSTDSWSVLEVRAVTGGTVVKFNHGSNTQCLMLNSFGAHFARNAMAALAAAKAVDADANVAALDLRNWQPPSGRGDFFEIRLHTECQPIQLVDDAFNANPASVAAALEALAGRHIASKNPNGRVIAVLGDMLELGVRERQLHQDISEHPSLANISQIHCAGPLMKSLYDQLDPDKRGIWRESADEVAAMATQIVEPGDLVLVKGSKGSQISIVADAIRSLDFAKRSTRVKS